MRAILPARQTPPPHPRLGKLPGARSARSNPAITGQSAGAAAPSIAGVGCTLTIVLDGAAAAGGDEALRRARTALDEAERNARPIEMVNALSALARCYRDAHAEVCETLLEQALQWARTTASTDLVVDLLGELCELGAELALREGSAGADAAADRARARGAEVALLAGGVADPVFEAATLLRLSAMHARLGDEAEAVALAERAQRSTTYAVPNSEREAIAAAVQPTLH